jgi:hypothetical protein
LAVGPAPLFCGSGGVVTLPRCYCGVGLGFHATIILGADATLVGHLLMARRFPPLAPLLGLLLSFM